MVGPIKEVVMVPACVNQTSLELHVVVTSLSSGFAAAPGYLSTSRAGINILIM